MYVTVGSASLPANVKISPRMGSFVDPNSWNLDPDICLNKMGRIRIRKFKKIVAGSGFGINHSGSTTLHLKFKESDPAN